MNRCFIICLLLVATRIQAQQYPAWHTEMEVKTISLEPDYKPFFALPFSGITVIDNRDDTSSIGYIEKRIGKKILRTVLNPSFREAVEYFVNQSVDLKPGIDSANILMVVNRFRLSDELPLEMIKTSNKTSFLSRIESGAVANCEFYLKRENGYYPLYRFDSSVVLQKIVAGNEIAVISLIFEAALKKLQVFTSTEEVLKRRRLVYSEIKSKNEKKWRLPALENANIKKGVYRSFAEFQLNNPFYKEYRIDSSKKMDLMFVKEADSMVLVYKNIWGYSDGINLYIKCADNFYPLTRCGNTYSFYGTKGFESEKVDRSFVNQLFNTDFSRPGTDNINYQRSSFGTKKKYYQLDMETGLVY